MSQTPPISVSTFTQKFRDVIRVGLNWDRFDEENWPIELVPLESTTDLNRCFMPWYIGPDGNEVAYDSPLAVPMRLTDVPKTMQLLNDERKADIQNYVDNFRSQKDVIEFNAPTYALPDEQYFILDRNHRLSALTLNGIRFKVTLWNVCGPLDPDGLLDVIHWVSPRKT